jgi:HEAT repeat protein
MLVYSQDILKEIYQLLESNAFPVRHAALQVVGHGRKGMNS